MIIILLNHIVTYLLSLGCNWSIVVICIINKGYNRITKANIKHCISYRIHISYYSLSMYMVYLHAHVVCVMVHDHISSILLLKWFTIWIWNIKIMVWVNGHLELMANSEPMRSMQIEKPEKISFSRLWWSKETVIGIYLHTWSIDWYIS